MIVCNWIHWFKRKCCVTMTKKETKEFVRVSWELIFFLQLSDVGIHWPMRISGRFRKFDSLYQCLIDFKVTWLFLCALKGSHLSFLSVFVCAFKVRTQICSCLLLHFKASVCAGFNYRCAAWIQQDWNHFHRLSVHVLLPHTPSDLCPALRHIVLLSEMHVVLCWWRVIGKKSSDCR